MEYFFKIKTDFDCFVQIENKLNKKMEKNTFISLKINLSENENFYIYVEPLVKSNGLIFPYKIYIKNNQDKLEIESNNIDLYSYLNKYLITLKKFEAIKDMKILLNGQNFSVFNTYCTNIATADESLSLNEIFTSVSSKKINSNTLITLENENKKFAVILNNNEIIFKDYFNEIKYDKNIEIFTKLNDISKHAILTRIENNSKVIKVVYENNKPNLIKNEKIIPLAFIQALKINNLNLCKYYLSDELKNVCTLENLYAFFGAFKKVEPIVLENNLVLFYEDKSYKIFNFSFENHKIKKIETK